MVASHPVPQFCSSTMPTSFERTGIVTLWDFASNKKVSVFWSPRVRQECGLSFATSSCLQSGVVKPASHRRLKAQRPRRLGVARVAWTTCPPRNRSCRPSKCSSVSGT